jgi:hypothetical protein
MRADLQLKSTVVDSCCDASSSDLPARLSSLPPSIIAACSYLVALQARTSIHLTPVKLSLRDLLPMHFVLLIPQLFLSFMHDSAAGCSDCMAPNDRLINELERMYTEAIVVNFEMLSQNFPGETEKKHEPQDSLSLGRDLNMIPPKYEAGSPAVRRCRFLEFVFMTL